MAVQYTHVAPHRLESVHDIYVNDMVTSMQRVNGTILMGGLHGTLLRLVPQVDSGKSALLHQWSQQMYKIRSKLDRDLERFFSVYMPVYKVIDVGHLNRFFELPEAIQEDMIDILDCTVEQLRDLLK